MGEKEVALVLSVVPSPKSQNRLVIVPVELSVKFTTTGAIPFVGAAVNSGFGSKEPTPVTKFVLLPPLLVKLTALLKLPALPGAKRTTTLVKPKPARLNGVPETRVKGPPLILATPLLIAAPPVLVTTKLASALVPASTSTIPKSILPGTTTSCAGVRPTPLNRLVRLPPLLAVKIIELLKLPALLGLKFTTTLVEPKPARLKLLTVTRLKGPPAMDTVTLVMGPPPRLVRAKVPCALLPSTTEPKSIV